MYSSIVAVLALTSLTGASGPWPWSGVIGDKAVSLMIIGDVQIHSRRADPPSAFQHLRDTLQRADLVYANLEGVLVPSQGPDGDIPDKKGWTHPGTGAIQALKSANIRAVGVANNVAYGRANILKTMELLKANGIQPVGGGRDIAAAHLPVIVERKGVKIAFLQYTARWYRDREQLATEKEAGVARILSRDGQTIDPGDLDRLRADVTRARGLADIVVVSHHNRDGATPVQFGPAAETPRGAARADRTKSEAYQRQFAHVALDTGADLVFGHGTHTIQGVERTRASRSCMRSAIRRSISRATRTRRTDSSFAPSFKVASCCASRSYRSRATPTTTSCCSSRRAPKARGSSTSSKGFRPA